MNVPDELRYSSDHEWVRVEGAVARIGITDYAQDALGDVVFVQVPEVGQVVQAGDSMGEVESTKSVSEIYAPLAGTVTEVNQSAADAPEIVNQDAYAAWLFRMTPDDAADLDQMLDAAAYQAVADAA